MGINLKRLALIAVGGALLASCGGSDNAAVVTPPVVVPPAARIEDGFGANFGTTYRADPNTEARDPAAGDISPVDATKEPTTI
jgi:hypothetical protein